MGGGVGLVAVSDWVIAEKAAQIGTPEVTVGIVPAQITPFIVQRIGTAQARRLAAFGLRLGADEAQRIGLVHEVADNHGELVDKGAAAINQCLRCAPGAVAETKKLVRSHRARGWAPCSTTHRRCSLPRWRAMPRRASAPSREAQAGVGEEDRAALMQAARMPSIVIAGIPAACAGTHREHSAQADGWDSPRHAPA